MLWNDFLAAGKAAGGEMRVPQGADAPAVVLYSLGITGITKGILLSNMNFNALGAQIVATNPIFDVGDKMLAIMPMFHGFGLGMSIHSMLANGCCCILVPRFTPQSPTSFYDIIINILILKLFNFIYQLNYYNFFKVI